MSTPNLLSDEICKSIGRGPNSHPPGNESFAFDILEIIGPKNTIDDRISCISSWGISLLVILSLFIITVLPSRFTVQPKYLSILIAASTSDRLGQFLSIVSPPYNNVAASIGNELFFAPWTATSPLRRSPPPIISRSIYIHPFIA